MLMATPLRNILTIPGIFMNRAGEILSRPHFDCGQGSDFWIWPGCEPRRKLMGGRF